MLEIVVLSNRGKFSWNTDQRIKSFLKFVFKLWCELFNFEICKSFYDIDEILNREKFLYSKNGYLCSDGNV